MGQNKIKVLFDNTTIYGEAFQNILKKDVELELCPKCFSIANIIQILKEIIPHVVILDTDYCYDTAIEITRAVKTHNSEIKIIGISLWNVVMIEHQLIDAGADVHLSKISQFENILSHIKN